MASLVAAEHPDPRRLTVLVHAKPPAAVERVLLALAARSTDKEERAFYRARAEGAYGSGFVLMRRYCPCSAAGLWWQRLLRTLFGLAGLLILYVGLSAVMPGQEETSETVYFALRFLRYGILGLWISLGAPWFFSLLRPLRSDESQVELQHA